MPQPVPALSEPRRRPNADALASAPAGARPAMRRVAVFCKAGGGKSTLAKRLANLTGLPLQAVDTIQHGPCGEKVPHERYPQIHAELLRRDAWIIDGLDCVASAWERLAAADTPVRVDLPLPFITGGSRSGSSRASSRTRKAGRRAARSGRIPSAATMCCGAAIAG
ncbi:hypothetical protein GCM10009416_48250 [Craurococcus roseus]|uniref:Uncharacterized protein n=1 Tax=Craurococcus roseus TaxID=77585 RepID=A0ABP3RCW5_9PROT